MTVAPGSRIWPSATGVSTLKGAVGGAAMVSRIATLPWLLIVNDRDAVAPSGTCPKDRFGGSSTIRALPAMLVACRATVTGAPAPPETAIAPVNSPVVVALNSTLNVRLC